jgi:hypothetical protein
MSWVEVQNGYSNYNPTYQEDKVFRTSIPLLTSGLILILTGNKTIQQMWANMKIVYRNSQGLARRSKGASLKEIKV